MTINARVQAFLGTSEAEGVELKADVTYVRNNEEQAVIEQEELIMSYKYGSDLVTVSDEDLANFTYEAGPKVGVRIQAFIVGQLKLLIIHNTLVIRIKFS